MLKLTLSILSETCNIQTIYRLFYHNYINKGIKQCTVHLKKRLAAKHCGDLVPHEQFKIVLHSKLVSRMQKLTNILHEIFSEDGP